MAPAELCEPGVELIIDDVEMLLEVGTPAGPVFTPEVDVLEDHPLPESVFRPVAPCEEALPSLLPLSLKPKLELDPEG